MDFYTYDRKSPPQLVRNSNPLLLNNVKEWQIWLYQRYAQANGGLIGRWGNISGKTVDQVKGTLASEQKFEKEYNKFFNIQDNTVNDTYFNPFGPVAILDISTPHSRLLEKVQQLQEFFTTYKELNSKFHDILSKDAKNNNTFSAVGKVLKEYGDNLRDASSKLNKLNNLLENVTNAELPNIENELNNISNSTNNINSTAQKNKRNVK